MTITIPDEVLKAAGVTERELLIDFACRLFQTKRLTLGGAIQLAGIGRTEFEGELHRRSIPAYEITAEVWQDELRALKSLQN